MAAATVRRFHFSHVTVFDPAVQRLNTWDKTISIPLLAINSEEYATGTEFTKFLAVVPDAEFHVMVGATHPSFSDVFLILPDHVNRWVGLMADPWQVIHQTVDTASRFLSGEETNGRTINCVDGVFHKDGHIGIGCLLRCRVDDGMDDAKERGVMDD